MALIYVLPVHNEAAILARNVENLRWTLEAFAGSRILLAENGSRDSSLAIARELAAQPGSVAVQALTIASAGIGHAYDLGIRQALADITDTTEHWLVLTAADLPFGFSDLSHAVPFLGPGQTASLLMGSKAHPRSQVHVSPERALASQVYRALRRIVAGMRSGDSQGSIFLRLDMASLLVRLIESRDFFYSTELVFHAERLGLPIVELPVVVQPEQRESTVRPWRHGISMLRSLLRQVHRWGRVPGRPKDSSSLPRFA